jgi:phage pi2 protein 07
MEAAKTELKERLKMYRELDDQLRQVNKVAYDLREKRKTVEFEMANILKTPALSQVGELRLENDNSYIRVQRPGMYSKGWSLSKRDLQNYIDHYFENAGPTANRQDCFDFIVRQQKANSLETSDFKFTRNVPSENIENE